MENREFEVIPPRGYEIDEENSTFSLIKFKPKFNSTTYKELTKEYFSKNLTYSLDLLGNICSGNLSYDTPTNGTSVNQLNKLLAINKLMNVAKMINPNWKPDWADYNQNKWYYELRYDQSEDKQTIVILPVYTIVASPVYFETYEDAERTICILGEDTIKLALSTDW